MTLYLFLLSPPYSGSTVLWQLLQTSPEVTALPDEGQFVPGAAEHLRARAWDPAKEVDWAAVKEVWERHWDPNRPVALEKSPPHLVRAPEIDQVFDPAAFLVMMRDPYALCEGLQRRNGWNWPRAVRSWVYCAELQARNLDVLQRRLPLNYEELCADPQAAAERILAFVPELGSLDALGTFRAHSIGGISEGPLHDFNEQKIARLQPADIEELSELLRPHGSLLREFGYVLRS